MITPEGAGTVFEVTLGGAKTPLLTFPTTITGVYPNSLIQASDGNLWGTTLLGGSQNFGVLFETTPTGKSTAPFAYSFPSDPALESPDSLVQGSDGRFYGTTNESVVKY